MAVKEKPATAGRKTKRTPETEARLFEALREGCTRRAACAHAGISEDTLANWLRDFSDFSDLIIRAENLAEVGYTRVVQQCALSGDGKMAIEWLKRRRKADWSERVEQEHTGKNGDPIPIAVQFIPYDRPNTDNT